jgi:hypothetical protein
LSENTTKNNAEVHRRTVIEDRCRRRRARAPSVRTRWDRDVGGLLTKKKPNGILPAARPPVSRVFWSTGCTKPKTDSMGGDVQTPGTVTAKRVCLATMGTIVAHGCESIACDDPRALGLSVQRGIWRAIGDVDVRGQSCHAYHGRKGRKETSGPVGTVNRRCAPMHIPHRLPSWAGRLCNGAGLQKSECRRGTCHVHWSRPAQYQDDHQAGHRAPCRARQGTGAPSHGHQKHFATARRRVRCDSSA